MVACLSCSVYFLSKDFAYIGEAFVVKVMYGDKIGLLVGLKDGFVFFAYNVAQLTASGCWTVREEGEFIRIERLDKDDNYRLVLLDKGTGAVMNRISGYSELSAYKKTDSGAYECEGTGYG